MTYCCTSCHIQLVKGDRGWIHIPLSLKELRAVNACPAYGQAVAQPYAISTEDNAYVDAQLAALWERSK